MPLVKSVSSDVHLEVLEITEKVLFSKLHLLKTDLACYIEPHKVLFSKGTVST